MYYFGYYFQENHGNRLDHLGTEDQSRTEIIRSSGYVILMSVMVDMLSANNEKRSNRDSVHRDMLSRCQ